MFALKENGTNWKRELLSGVSIFASMAYVTYINPTILEAAGLPFGSVLVATIIVTFLASLLMGLIANYPICIAPGIGVSAFLAYSVVGEMGQTWQTTLAATLCASTLVLLLALFHVRRRIISSIPDTLLRGIGTGIGLFLICIALKNIGAIHAEDGAIIHFGTIKTAGALFTLCSILLLIILFRFNINSGFLWVILLNWGIGIWLGYAEWKGVFALPPSLAPTFAKFQFPQTFSPHYLVVIFSIFLIAFFDSTGGLMILAKEGKFLVDGKLPRMQRALIPDSTVSVLCPILGTGNLAVHIESLAGIHAGGRTGLSALVCASLFLICLFLYPLISSIPLFATAPVLIMLGAKMCREAVGVKWRSLSDVIPFLIIAITMPLTFSIYHGFAFGFISYVIIKLLFGKWREIHISTAIFALLFIAQLSYSFFRSIAHTI